MTNLTLESIQFFLSQLAENSDSVYWLGDPEFTNLAYISPAYEEIWGRPRQVLYDNPELWITYLHPEDREEHPILAMKERVRIEGGKAHFKEDYRIVRPDGSIRWILDRGFTVCDTAGNCIAVTGVATDITEKMEQAAKLEKALIAAEESNRAKSEFIQNMSHDLRTPLTGLLTIADGYAGALSDVHPHKESFEMIRDSSKQLRELFESVLETAGLEHQDGAIDRPENFSMNEIAQAAVDLFKPSFTAKKLEYRVEALDDQANMYQYLGYPIMIKRILINLLGNAIKFTDKGKITLQYGLMNRTEDNSETDNILQIIVSDTGKGIPKTDHERIFHKFTRLTPSYQGTYMGHGLGLYITNQLINLMGGSITVESDGEEQGSRFQCMIPIKMDDDCYNILLADDTRAARKGAILFLKNHLHKKCNIDEAETIEQISNCVSHKPYNLIITELNFPDGSGGQPIVEKIKDRNLSKNSETPIIALTGRVDDETRNACLSIGMKMVLCKPLKRDVIQSIEKDCL